MSDVLNVTARETRGSRSARRQRAEGNVPAVLYGHGKESVSLSVPADELDAAIRHRSHVVDLRGAVTESALIKDLQWDAYGTNVLHVDFTRVEAGETVEASIGIELRGDAPGAKEGGVVNQLVREIDIDCPVGSMPEVLSVSINDLGIDGSIVAGEIELPRGAKLVGDADQVVVQCVVPMPEAEEGAEPGAEGVAEPEVIGRKAAEEEGAGGE